MRLKNILSGVLLLSTCTAAFAHTPYLAPLTFESSNQDRVTLDAGFAEVYFIPELAFNNSIFTVTNPDGKVVNPDSLVKLNLRTVVEHQLKEKGTYRFSTGKRLGRVFKMYKINGERKSLENPEDPIPEGGELLAFFQSITQAETYVTKGAPDNVALKPYGKGLEFVAISHPNDLFVEEDLSLVSHFDGKPLADLSIDVFQAKDQFSSAKPTITLTSNAKGEFTFTPEKTGVYLLRARYRSQAPQGSPAPQISNTYTLVVEATE